MSPSLPTSDEAEFGLPDLFFSATDAKGFIRSANAVFTRVSGYPPDEWLGAPHKLVRHDDMPRAVFRVLWDALDRGRPVAAYVKNRTKDGHHYWVLALAFPIGEELFSLRLKPSAGILPVVQDLYRSLLAEERAIEATDSRSVAIEASLASLDRALAGLGYASYEQFMSRVLPAEVSARFAGLGTDAGRLLATPRSVDLRGPHALCASGLAQLVRLSARLESFEGLAASYRSASVELAELADEVSMFALNAGLAAARAGARSEVLGAIARLMRASAHDVAVEVEQLDDLLGRSTSHIRALGFAIARSSLALEVVGQFLAEIDQDEHAARTDHGPEDLTDRRSTRARHDADALIRSTAEQLESAAALFDDLPTMLGTLSTSLRRLLSHLRSLRILRIRAEVDSAGDAAADSFAEIVERIEAHLVRGLGRLEQLGKDTSAMHDVDAGAQARELRGRGHELRHHRLSELVA
ncbi:MAG: PAS domain-containing protein [Acidimicrobiales bacterium]